MRRRWTSKAALDQIWEIGRSEVESDLQGDELKVRAGGEAGLDLVDVLGLVGGWRRQKRVE